jgi:hypothetical protein
MTGKIQGNYHHMKWVCAGESAVHAGLCMSLVWMRHQNPLPNCFRLLEQPWSCDMHISAVASPIMKSVCTGLQQSAHMSLQSRQPRLASSRILQLLFIGAVFRKVSCGFLDDLSLWQSQQQPRRRGVSRCRPLPPCTQLLWRHVGFEVLTTVTMKGTTFLVVMQCSLLKRPMFPSSGSELN